MRKLFYHLTTFLSRILGRWIFKLFAWFVASGYFLFAPNRVRNSMSLYRRLFPMRHHFFHLHCAWRQFHNFTDVFIDRFMVQSTDKLEYRSEGIEYLSAELEKGKGAILVMSHMGNWDVAAQLLMDHLALPRVLLFMGRKQKEQIEQIQKQQLINSGLRIIAVDQDAGSPLDIVEGVKFLETGGVVSLTGDRVWKKDQRSVRATFLEAEIRLPQTPHLFALLTNAPLFIFFAFRTGKNQYQFSMSKPIHVTAENRADRGAAIERCAQMYADALEEALRRYPLQWYHFDDFLFE